MAILIPRSGARRMVVATLGLLALTGAGSALAWASDADHAVLLWQRLGIQQTTGVNPHRGARICPGLADRAESPGAFYYRQ